MVKYSRYANAGVVSYMKNRPSWGYVALCRELVVRGMGLLAALTFTTQLKATKQAALVRQPTEAR
jgi:hypothetical protein